MITRKFLMIAIALVASFCLVTVFNNAYAKNDKGNQGNGYGNTGTGNQGNDKEVGNAGGNRGGGDDPGTGGDDPGTGGDDPGTGGDDGGNGGGGDGGGDDGGNGGGNGGVNSASNDSGHGDSGRGGDNESQCASYLMGTPEWKECRWDIDSNVTSNGFSRLRLVN